MSEIYQPMTDAIDQLCQKFGAKLRRRETDDPVSHNGAIRPYNENRGYLAITRPEEPLSQAYSALSFVVFPLESHIGKDRERSFTCVVSICIGTSDLGEDEELAALPYLRRAYTKLLPSSKRADGFIKTSFTDTLTESTALFRRLEEGERLENWDLKEIVKYKKLLPAAIILTFTESEINETLNYIESEGLDNPDNEFTILAGWLAQYAKIRGWSFRSTNNNRYNLQDNAVRAASMQALPSDMSVSGELKQLLEEDGYVVVQGAPGTGKTRAALRLAKQYYDKVFFTQFHADTTSTDFVGGITPMLGEHSKLGYKYKEGILTQAIRHATGHSKEKVLLIIDEINRANLQNVVGPMFYLFEHSVTDQPAERSCAPLRLDTAAGDAIFLSTLPPNLHVIATMNTSDRSLAVVDFALRRRFVWYTMPVMDLGENVFGGEYQSYLFHSIAELFDKYATDEELSLQPGHSYFIAENREKMKRRLEYEIMPLMKEYFANGLMTAARDEFADLYFRETGKFMYR